MNTVTKYDKFYSDWAKLYESGKSTVQISKIFGCSNEAVRNAIKKMGFITRTHSEAALKYSAFHAEWARLYENGKNSHEIASDYNCSVTAVLYGIRASSGKIRTNSQAQRKHRLDNERYFENIDSQEKAYWFGFIMADGHVHDYGKQKALQINVAVKDETHMSLFKEAIGSSAPIRHFVDKRFGGELINLSIYSSQMAMDLMKHGCWPKKSRTMVYPKIEPSFNRHFIRGYFDGDGCICLTCRKAKWSLLGNYAFLNAVQDIMISEIGLSKNKISKRRDSQTLYELGYGGNRQIRDIRKWLYEGATTSMQRKYDKISAV
jgi:hypothetical protein